jgi:translocation and assembly module TamB
MEDMTPGLELSAKTVGLSLVGASRRITDVDGASTIVPPTWHLQGIDFAIDSRIDGDSGFADLAVALNDPKGELIDVDVKSAAVPYAKLLATPTQSVSILESVAFNARVNVPKRSLEALPPLLAVEGGRGDLEGFATITGPALKPQIDAEVKLTKARAHAAGLELPVDLDLTAHYDGAHLDANLLGSARGEQAIDANAAADVSAADLLAGNLSNWTGSASAQLDRFPVEALAALGERQITGTLSGEASLDGLRKDAKAKVDLTVNDLKVGDVTYVAGKLGATLGDGALNADLRFDQVDGFVDVHAHAGAKWGAAVFPTLDPTKDLDCALRANRFRAAMLLPYVDDVFTELDARVDADVKAELDPRTRTAKVNGTLDVSQGRFELASVGGEFHDASMKLVFTPDGIVRVTNMKASGMSGQIEAAASVRLINLVPVSASANVVIPGSNPLLLTVEGAQFGTLAGKMAITAKLSGDRNKISATVDIPSLHVELPLTSSQDVQALGDLDGVRIGTDGPHGFVPERLDAAKVELAAPSNKTFEVAVTLGRDVQVKRGATLKVALEGKPTVTITDKVRAGGQIRLVRGSIDVQGKSFSIDNGTVSFVGDDATNPQVVVTASWVGPEGTTVYADFVGPLKTGKVTLRSDPTLPQNEILALLLFGTPDGVTPASQSTSAGTTGAGVAGGAAAQPLNSALESYGLGGVTTRVDTSQVNPRPEVEVQIARDISLQVAYVIGTPPPGQNPDTALFTLNWHFIRAWSLETTVGNSGTSIFDLIWQYRY